MLSPPGSGVDCYRHWEAMLCGAVPIVEYSPLAAELLAGLPALVVRSWTEVDAAFLERELAALRSATFDLRKLTSAFWVEALDRAARSPELPLPERRGGKKRGGS